MLMWVLARRRRRVLRRACRDGIERPSWPVDGASSFSRVVSCRCKLGEVGLLGERCIPKLRWEREVA